MDRAEYAGERPCRNEGQLANHTGGWGINIEVDESRAD